MRLQFRRSVLNEVAAGVDPVLGDEMAIPSYLHRNPAIQWLIARRMAVVLRLADIGAGDRVLDFGCGVGMLPLHVPEGLAELHATDVVVEPAERFLRAHGRSDVNLYPAADWLDRIEDESLDCVIALEVLEHVDDVATLAGRFRQKLCARGRLVVCGPTENRLYALGRKVAGFSGQYHHRNVYDFMGDVESAGFRSICQKRIPTRWPFELFVATRYERDAAYK